MEQTVTDQNTTMRVEEARRVLAQFDAEARAQAEAQQAAIAAEHERQTARRKRWAATYAATAPADLAAAHAARHAARAAFLDALAAEPWAQALIAWQQAENGPAAAANRASHARVILGQSRDTNERGPAPLVDYLNGVPNISTILRALGTLLAESAPFEPMAAVDAWVAAPDDTADPMPA